MDLVQWLKNRWQAETVRNTYFRIPDANVHNSSGVPLTPTAVKAGEQYFQIWLTEMFLKNSREWGSSWYPAVMASVQLKFGNKAQEITHLAGESALKDFKMSDINKGVAVNHAITTVLPFNGGAITLEAALLAMAGKSDIASLIKVLGNFSKLLVVPQLSAALAVAEPLADGIAELVGATNAHPELRLQDTWGGDASGNPNVLRAGYFAVISAPDGEVRPEELQVRDGRLYRGESAMSGYHYMLFRVDVNSTRDDWDSISSISDPWQDAIGVLENSLKADDPAVQQGMKSEAEKRFASARIAAFRAPELTSVVGKNQVLDALDRRWKEAKSQLGLGAVKEDFPRKLSAAMRNPLPVKDAIERGEPDEEDLWASSGL
jgi:hypothetical protein